MTSRLEEMAKAGYSAACKREKVRELPWADVRERGWISDARVMVERLLEIAVEKIGDPAYDPVSTRNSVAYLRGILTEHDLETTEPPRPSRP